MQSCAAGDDRIKLVTTSSRWTAPHPGLLPRRAHDRRGGGLRRHLRTRRRFWGRMQRWTTTPLGAAPWRCFRRRPPRRAPCHSLHRRSLPPPSVAAASAQATAGISNVIQPTAGAGSAASGLRRRRLGAPLPGRRRRPSRMQGLDAHRRAAATRTRTRVRTRAGVAARLWTAPPSRLRSLSSPELVSTLPACRAAGIRRRRCLRTLIREEGDDLYKGIDLYMTRAAPRPLTPRPHPAPPPSPFLHPSPLPQASAGVKSR